MRGLRPAETEACALESRPHTDSQLVTVKEAESKFLGVLFEAGQCDFPVREWDAVDGYSLMAPYDTISFVRLGQFDPMREAASVEMCARQRNASRAAARQRALQAAQDLLSKQRMLIAARRQEAKFLLAKADAEEAFLDEMIASAQRGGSLNLFLTVVLSAAVSLTLTVTLTRIWVTRILDRTQGSGLLQATHE